MSKFHYNTIFDSIECSPTEGVAIRIRHDEIDSATGEKTRDLWETIGLKFVNGFSIAEDEMCWPLLRTFATVYGVLALQNRAKALTVKYSLTPDAMRFIRECQRITSSWHSHFVGGDLAQVSFQLGSFLAASYSEPKRSEVNLDFNKVVLGSSGGKESTLNRMILASAGYEVEEVTFAKSVVEIIPSTSIALRWEPDDYMSTLILPEVKGPEGMSFDPQDNINIPMYGMLTIQALATGSGILAVGSEFGVNKVWYPTDSDAKSPVYDLACGESVHITKALEAYCASEGLPVHIVSPVGALHELGIIRALRDKHFNVGQLESCWNAHVMGVKYCGACHKCQRIATYVGMLDKAHPGKGWDSVLGFDDLGLASGSMLSYSMQYHLTEDHPELPWSTAIIAEKESLELLDHRTGNRILKVLVNEYGFTDTIYPQLYEQKLELRSLSEQEFRQRVVEYLGFDYASYDKFPAVSTIRLTLPFEDMLSREYDNAEWAPLITKVTHVPLWNKWAKTWAMYRITPENPLLFWPLILPKEALNSQVMKTWLDVEAFSEGLKYHKVEAVKTSQHNHLIADALMGSRKGIDGPGVLS